MPIRVYYEVLNQKGTPALYSDNYASRPAAGYTGRIFYSPDTAQIFYDTGTTWTLLADAGVGSGSLASVCANGNTTATGIVITAGGLSTNSLTSTNLTAGSIPFIGTGGLFNQDNSNLFWDNTNKYLGINTNTPTAPFDIHTTANVGMQINNTTTADSKIAFLNASVGKWRIGNLYSSGNNFFHIYNNTAGNNAMTINSANSVTFTGSVTTVGLIADSLQIVQGTTIITSGRTGIGALVNGLTIGLDSGVTQQLYFPTATAYIYTYPSSTGTLVNATSFTSGVIPKYSSTAGVLTASMLSDDGTTLVSAGATRSNLYLKAVNNTYYSQLAFTNGSNGSYGGISYNNASQDMQFETATSEWARLTSTGQFLLSTTSTGYNNPILLVKAQSGTCVPLQAIADSGGRLIRFYTSDYNNSTTGTDVRMGFGAGTGNTNFQIQVYNSGETTSGNLLLQPSYGRVMIGGDSGLSSLKFEIWGASATSSNYTQANYDNNGGDLMYIRCDGYGYLKASAWAYGSDARIKENINYIETGLDKILQLKPAKFDYINGIKDNIGWIAQDVQQIIPEAVNTLNENSDQLTLRSDFIVPYLVKAVQELNEKIENLN